MFTPLPTLQGELLRLRPLRPDDFERLYAVAQDPLIWEQHPASDRHLRHVFQAFFDEALAGGSAYLAERRSDGAVLGSSRYYDVDLARRELAIGYTFLSRSVWGGRHNGELKRLMLEYAFRYVDRVLFHVGPKNLRSQQALKKIGAHHLGPVEHGPAQARKLSELFELRPGEARGPARGEGGEVPKAVVLFSGGLDSATCAAIARAEGFAPHALSVRYGQRHAAELLAAERVAQSLAIPQRTVSLDLRAIGGSALTSDALAVPKDRPLDEAIPSTYVPARNTVLLSLALGYAEVLGAQDIYVGVNAVDYSGYPDCRPAFVEAFEQLANVATAAAVEGRARFRIRAPLLHLTKAQIIQRGVELGVPYGLTLSCYDPDLEGRGCRRCDSCRLRAQGFQAAGVPDPTRYAEG